MRRSSPQRLFGPATQYGRHGYRRVRQLLGDEGWRVSVKRVYRIWRREGLKVLQKQPKPGRPWLMKA
jgi:putative transposase